MVKIKLAPSIVMVYWFWIIQEYNKTKTTGNLSGW